MIRSGRLADPTRPDEVVVSEPFAEAHRLKPGDSFDAILKGRKRNLQVVGTALSPEYVYAIAPGGLMPDDERFGVLWMGRDALAAAFDLKASFNSVTLSLLPNADEKEVIRKLDGLLVPFGGVGPMIVRIRPQIGFWKAKSRNRKTCHGSCRPSSLRSPPS